MYHDEKPHFDSDPTLFIFCITARLSPDKLEMIVTHRVTIEEYRYLFTEKPDGTVPDIEVETDID